MRGEHDEEQRLRRILGRTAPVLTPAPFDGLSTRASRRAWLSPLAFAGIVAALILVAVGGGVALRGWHATLNDAAAPSQSPLAPLEVSPLRKVHVMPGQLRPSPNGRLLAVSGGGRVHIQDTIGNISAQYSRAAGPMVWLEDSSAVLLQAGSDRARTGSLVILETGGRSIETTANVDALGIVTARLSPDNRTIALAYYNQCDPCSNRSGIITISRDGKDASTLYQSARDVSFLGWDPAGHLVLRDGGEILAWSSLVAYRIPLPADISADHPLHFSIPVPDRSLLLFQSVKLRSDQNPAGPEGHMWVIVDGTLRRLPDGGRWSFVGPREVLYIAPDGHLSAYELRTGRMRDLPLRLPGPGGVAVSDASEGLIAWLVQTSGEVFVGDLGTGRTALVGTVAANARYSTFLRPLADGRFLQDGPEGVFRIDGRWALAQHPAPAPLRSCGTVSGRTSDPLEASRALDCMWQSYQHGTPSEMRTAKYTNEGDLIVLVLRVRSTSAVEVIVQSDDRFGPSGTFLYVCTTMRPPPYTAPGPLFSGCAGDGDQMTW